MPGNSPGIKQHLHFGKLSIIVIFLCILLQFNSLGLHLAQAIVYSNNPDASGMFNSVITRQAPYQPSLSVWSEPAVFIQDSNFTIFANVEDKFGEIKDANLSYHVDSMGQENVRMQLVYGFPSNGTYSASIPSQSAGSMVEVELYFRDNLGFEVRYHAGLAVVRDSEPPTLECHILPNNEISTWQEIKIHCSISDKSGIVNATSFDKVTKVMTMLHPISANESGGIYESTFFEPGDPNTDHALFISAVDYAGNNGTTASPVKYSIMNESQYLNVKVEIIEVDTKQRIVTAKFSAEGKVPMQDGEAPTIQIPTLIDGQKKYIFLPVHVLDPSRLRELLTYTASLELEGEPWLYPFDSYRTNTDLTIQSLSLDHVNTMPNYAEAVSNYWYHHLENKTEISGQRYVSTSQTISFTFSRIPYVAAGIYLPLFGIFYLLGTIFVIQRHHDQLTNKLAISIGAFAFIFTFTEVINTLKPSTGGIPTIADLMIFSAAIATIGYSIGGVFETHYKKRRHIDKLVFVAVSSVIIGLFIVQQSYDPQLIVPILSGMIGGLGYGVLVRQLRPGKLDDLEKAR